MEAKKNKVVIASDIHGRDGIGIEVYSEDKLVMEIFRDDTLKTRTITVYQENMSLELMEEGIATFKKKIPWDFMNS